MKEFKNYKIRLAKENDRDSIWTIFRRVIETGDTYVFDPNTPKEAFEKHWLSKQLNTYVVESQGEIMATYIIKPNQLGLGSHVANASYMVHPNKQGQGIGKLMCEHSLKTAKELGFRSMQFNIVVSTNEPGIRLWKKFGFEVIGTIPEGFYHQTLGFVDAHIMFKKLID